jgi:diacylglycerol kinase (ATP)
MARLPAVYRERVEAIPFGPPWDFEPAVAQAKAAGGPLLVWGGDGTIHHAGRYLIDNGCPVPLGAVPGGSGNGLARGLRTPLEPAGAVARLLEGRELRMDLPRLDGVPFLNLCGTGFEAEVAHAFHQANSRGFWTYARLCLGLWRTYHGLGVRWDAAVPLRQEPTTRMERLKAAWRGPEPELPEEAWSLCFANLPQYGSGLWIAPHADPTDGLIQWVRLHRPGLTDFLSEVTQLFREGGNTILRQEGRIHRAIIQLDRPAPWHLDGEPVPARDRAEITLEPQAFRMQVTNGCPWS